MSTESPSAGPSGTITFLFSDIEGSTARWERDRETAGALFEAHDRLLATVCEQRGHVFKTVGDAFCVSFDRPDWAADAAAEIQRSLAVAGWNQNAELKVRIALHVGFAQERDGDYFGPVVNRVARLLAAAHGGQIVLSQATQQLIRDSMPRRTSLLDLGEHELADLSSSERIYQLSVDGLQCEFPPLNTAGPGASHRGGEFDPPSSPDGYADEPVVKPAPAQERREPVGESFGLLLRRYRKAAGLTQHALGLVAYCSPDYIRKLEGHSRAPSTAMVEEFVRALRLDIEERDLLRQAAAGAWKSRAAERSPPEEQRPQAHVELAPIPSSSPAIGLPLFLDSFVGRRREISDIQGVLADPSVRLLTLTGPGGTGKTRLAVRAAEKAASLFPDGVCYVDLVPVLEPVQVMSAVRAALGVPEDARGETETVVEQLTGKNALLVLDNCEHVIEARGGLADVLRRCSHVKALATSRRKVGIPGERRYEVATLAQTPMLAGPDDRGRSEAVELFVQRARLAVSDFDPSGAEETAIASVCSLLDGLPLAIELVAARVSMLSPAEILTKLSESQAAWSHLRTGKTGGSTQHQTLWSAIEWSYLALAPVCRALLSSLSVFRGGFTLRAADAVCAGDGLDVEAGVAELIDCSLVRRVGGASTGESRYDILETIRLFAAEQLAGENADRLRAGHARFFQALAGEFYPRFREGWDASEQTREGADWSRPNMRIAFDWLLAREDRDDAALLLGSAGDLWVLGYRYSEAWEMFCRVLPDVGAEGPSDLRLLGAAAFLKRELGAYQDATDFLQRALPLARESMDHWELPRILRSLGQIALLRADTEEAIVLFNQSLEASEAVLNPTARSLAVDNLVSAYLMRGDTAQAEALLIEAVEDARRAGNKAQVAHNLLNMAEIGQQVGNLDAIERNAREALGLSADFGDDDIRMYALLHLAEAGLRRGDLAQATRHIRACLEIESAMSRPLEAIVATELTAAILGLSGREGPAALLWGSAAHQRDLLDIPILDDWKPRRETYLQSCRDHTGQQEWDAQWSAGQLLSMEAMEKSAQELAASGSADGSRVAPASSP